MKIQFNAHFSHFGGIQKTSNGKNYRELIVRSEDTQYFSVRFYREHWHQLKQLQTGNKITLTCQAQAARQFNPAEGKVINTVLFIGKEIQPYEFFLQYQQEISNTQKKGNQGLELAIPWSETNHKKRNHHASHPCSGTR